MPQIKQDQQFKWTYYPSAILSLATWVTAFKAFLDSASVKVAKQSYTEQTLKFSRIKVKNLRYRHQPRPCITWTEYESVTSTGLDRGYTYLDTAEARGAKYG
ncbi:hypothetical protein C8R45DRAFT_923377 [Mycena sanguinolenta]|nr:hypothetical protein C8R45DRAFT_923377 [Mycena sanguinolenta]